MARKSRNNALVALGISADDLERELKTNAAVKAEKKRVAQELVDHAKSISPVDEGDYAAGWHVEQGRGAEGETKAINRHWKAHMIEYGTGPDKKGDDEKRYRPGAGVALGPDTRTPAFAIAEKTAHAFGGDLTSGVDVDEDDE
ncbi:hypothetical protein A5746_00820 [Mycolicibacterium conceptionense]|uniref:HK97 gp10 family phage protein n=1 Tax=Mycolicibacterium conceptionense TaxID=451644 RepID=UPI00031C5AA7|nr:HK97 gp10 family phage protein [Mycolicibacterium conceptionense]OBK09007.1 hypothetical protein A5639_11780 [Mycolicibacterium conceptionense]OMB98716.1 hypothetical protein A5746_00820 [Mycolicibacterium conceptionense]